MLFDQQKYKLYYKQDGIENGKSPSHFSRDKPYPSARNRIVN